MSCSLRQLLFATLFLWAAPLFAGELYYTGFENFTPGNDTIAGTDGWTGSASHAGFQLSGVDAETDHLVSGIGNAAVIGGRATVLPQNVTSRTVNVRRAFNEDPLATNVLYPDGREVVQFYVNFGIQDSTFTGVNPRRDNFEFAFYNSSGQLLAFIQFDNTTLDNQTQVPSQKILRSNWQGAAFNKVDTGTTFFYDVLMQLQIRINFRTNRWTATLDGLDIFADVPFYTGNSAKTFGTIAAQMQIVNSALIPDTLETGLAPGDNYMIFDNFVVRMDPLPEPVFYSLTFSNAGAPQFTWLNEALYKYQVQYRDDLTQAWKNDLPASFSTATITGHSTVFTDSTAAGKTRRFYRVVRTAP
jgi:hypothetical protein